MSAVQMAAEAVAGVRREEGEDDEHLAERLYETQMRSYQGWNPNMAYPDFRHLSAENREGWLERAKATS